MTASRSVASPRIGRRPSRRRVASSAAVLVALVVTGCSPRDDAGIVTPPPGEAGAPAASDTVPALPPIGSAVVQEEATDPAADTAPGVVALVDGDGRITVAGDSRVADDWRDWRALPSHDGTTAVMTIQPETARTIDRTPISWVTLPDVTERTELVLPGIALEADAVTDDGGLVALSSFAAEVRPGEIAGAKERTTVVIADEDGERYRTELDGNFVVEAFGRRLGPDGLPAQLFLLEHVPADAPTHYRVRVLSTETDAVSLPLNLRDKSQQLDERMAGVSRSQVLADEDGLLFTLYRGTIDGTPDGEPYAFVHTLDLADGVWCLDVDPSLELDRLPGSLAVAGHRLYLASANGRVASMPVPSITDPSRTPTTDWVVQATAAARRPPVLLADEAGVWIGPDDALGRLLRRDSAGRQLPPHDLPAGRPTALGFGGDGSLVAAGDDWSTFGDPALPAWFGQPAMILTGG